MSPDWYRQRASLAEPTGSDRPVESSRRGQLSHLYFRYVAFYCRSLLAPLQTHPAPPRAILPAIHGVAAHVASKQPEIVHHTRASLTNRQLWDRPNVICVPSIFTHAFLRPRQHSVLSLLPFFSHRSQAPRATERLRPAARRSSASLSCLNRSWFLPLRGHPPRKQTLALGSSLPLAPSGWCALRDSGHQRRFSDVRIC
jgi:hypothetical protein